MRFSNFIQVPYRSSALSDSMHTLAMFQGPSPFSSMHTVHLRQGLYLISHDYYSPLEHSLLKTLYFIIISRNTNISLNTLNTTPIHLLTLICHFLKSFSTF